MNISPGRTEEKERIFQASYQACSVCARGLRGRSYTGLTRLTRGSPLIPAPPVPHISSVERLITDEREKAQHMNHRRLLAMIFVPYICSLHMLKNSRYDIQCSLFRYYKINF